MLLGPCSAASSRELCLLSAESLLKRSRNPELGAGSVAPCLQGGDPCSASSREIALH